MLWGIPGLTVVAFFGLTQTNIATGQTPNVRAWGSNFYGQLGNGVDQATASRSVPEKLSTLTGVMKLAAGPDHSVAVITDGTVWAWGRDIFGELGNGRYANSSLPVRVAGLTNVVDVAAGGGAFGGHSLALKNDGTVWAWGCNESGELGHGSGARSIAVPVQAIGLTSVIAIAASESHSLALKRDGTVWAWGHGFQAALGSGSNADVLPATVDGLTGIMAIAAGAAHNLALRSDGTVWAWGRNDSGQLGDRRASSHTPVHVSALTGVVVAIAGGWQHSLALKSDGTVWAWGDGLLVIGGHDSPVPVQVAGLTGVVAIAGGGVTNSRGAYAHSLALKADGTVWAWGDERSYDLCLGR